MRTVMLTDFLLERLEMPQDKVLGSGRRPLNRQIYQLIREAVLSRLLRPGYHLPSSRELAIDLGLSRNTVMYAYEQLISEGYLETRTGAGTFVTDTVPDQIAMPAGSDQPRVQTLSMGLSPRGREIVEGVRPYDVRYGAFMTGMPDVTQFPCKTWARMCSKAWARPEPDLLEYGQGGGYMPLREQIASHLQLARSVNCTAQQVFITAGIHQAIDLILKLLAQPGDTAWMEEPGYWGTRGVLTALDIHPVPVTVDAEGMQLRPESFERPPKLLFCTPSHQYPLGTTMSLTRRRLLLEYAAAYNFWIVEDDYDSEFRYGSGPLSSLQGMDVNGRVLYVGTFSKTLFPSLRVGFVVVPKTLAECFGIGLSGLYRGGQTFLEVVLSEFLAGGYYASHIRRMRLLYARRLALLQEAVRKYFGEDAMMGDDAGLHLVLRLPDHCDDVAVSGSARTQGIITRPLSLYYSDQTSALRGLLLGYACVPDALIHPTFERLAKIIHHAIRAHA